MDFWALMYLTLGIVIFAAWLGQGVCFAFCSERLTRRARARSFRAILRQDMSFFNEPHHTVGALTALLSSSSTKLSGLSGAILGAILTALGTLVGGVALSLAVGWKLALVCAATVPVVLGCGWARLRTLSLFEQELRRSLADSASFATEAVAAVRTVASTCLERWAVERYGAVLDSQGAESLRAILKASALYAASQSLVFLVAALGFWYGGGMIADGEYTVFQFFICFAALVSGSQSVGAVFSFAPDISRALEAGRELMVLFDRQPTIDDSASDSDGGASISQCDGAIELRDVTFAYPSRPEQEVLHGVSFSVRPGQFVALVGPSGCGKSTVIALLERFFDPASGEVLLDGQNIARLKVRDYRGRVSLVGQEPTLYEGTIMENLVLGVQDGDVSAAAVEKACREASIYDFITSLP